MPVASSIQSIAIVESLLATQRIGELTITGAWRLLCDGRVEFCLLSVAGSDSDRTWDPEWVPAVVANIAPPHRNGDLLRAIAHFGWTPVDI